MRKQQGFTLIELLVVIIIIGIIVSMSLATIYYSRPTPLQLLSAQINNLAERGKEFAMRYNKLSRLIVDNEYGEVWVQYFDYEHNNWHNSELPLVSFEVESQDKGRQKEDRATREKYLPQVLIYPSGKVQEQSLTITTKDDTLTLLLGEKDEEHTTHFITKFN